MKRNFLLLLFVLSWGGLVGCGLQPDTAVFTTFLTPDAPPTAVPTITAVPPLPTPDPYSLAGFNEFVERVSNARRADRQRLVNDYLARLPQTPLRLNGRAVFIWRGQAQAVYLRSDLNNWQWPDPTLEGEGEGEPSPHALQRLPETDTWYLVASVPNHGRVAYKFWLNNQREELDLFNPDTILGPDGPRSLLTMPEHSTPPELAANRPPVPESARGTLTRETVESALLGETRTLFVYTPAVPATTADGRYPTLYVNDGTAYLNQIEATTLLDWLIYHEEIPPITAVFVPPINRLAEYGQPATYNAFLVTELLPLVQANYGVSPRAADTAVLGSSLGGLAALEAAFTYPDTFGQVAAHSADLTVGNQALTRRLQLQTMIPVRVHLGVGLFETAVLMPTTAVENQEERHDLLAAKRALAETLGDKNGDYLFTERAEGHNWGQWGAQFGTAVRFLFNEQ